MENLVRLALACALILPLIGLVVAVVKVLALPRPRSPERVVEIFFRQYLLFCIALSFLCNFVVHTFFGHLAAPLIGWLWLAKRHPLRPAVPTEVEHDVRVRTSEV